MAAHDKTPLHRSNARPLQKKANLTLEIGLTSSELFETLRFGVTRLCRVPTGLSEYLKRCEPSVSPLGLCELFNNPIPLVSVNYSNNSNPLNLETL